MTSLSQGTAVTLLVTTFPAFICNCELVSPGFSFLKAETWLHSLCVAKSLAEGFSVDSTQRRCFSLTKLLFLENETAKEATEALNDETVF